MLQVEKLPWYLHSIAGGVERASDTYRKIFDNWGRTKIRYTWQWFFLEMIINDLPERCPNSCSAFNGTFTHRMRHSFQTDENIVLSCSFYQLENMNTFFLPRLLMVRGKSVVINTKIGGVREWQNPAQDIPNSTRIFSTWNKKIPAVELSFKMIYNSIISLQDWVFSSNSSYVSKGKVTKTYIQAIGFLLVSFKHFLMILLVATNHLNLWISPPF